MFEKELAYFKAHQDELVRDHKGKILVLSGENVVGVYGTPLEAYLDAQRTYAQGTYMLQPCEPGPSAYTVTII